ncbi:MAG: methyltransferase domain-containing protein [Betaproteobacteria bacterium]
MSSQVEEAAKLYSTLAARYDDETRFIAGVRRQAIDALNLQPGESVLDAGCGTGWCLPILAEKVGDSGRVIGFEPSSDMLALAQARVRELALSHVTLLHDSGDTALLPQAPDAILFSYTHDLIRTRSALEHLFKQARPGTRIVAVSTKLFPKWFFPGNWYLRYTHRLTITNFDGFDQPWTILAGFCSSFTVQVTVPGSRYIFRGTLA